MADAPTRGRMTRIPLIYVAGPFAGATNYEIQQNVARAEAIALHIAQVGGLGVCVHSMNRNFFGQRDEDWWLEAVLTLLSRCDGIVMTPDWERSKGARIEWQWALDHKLPYLVYFNGHEGAAHMRLERWITGILADLALPEHI